MMNAPTFNYRIPVKNRLRPVPSTWTTIKRAASLAAGVLFVIFMFCVLILEFSAGQTK